MSYLFRQSNADRQAQTDDFYLTILQDQINMLSRLEREVERIEPLEKRVLLLEKSLQKVSSNNRNKAQNNKRSPVNKAQNNKRMPSNKELMQIAKNRNWNKMAKYKLSISNGILGQEKVNQITSNGIREVGYL